MRSMKLLVAAALVAVLAAGPVLAQDTMSPSTTSTDTAKPAKTMHKKHAKKHSKKTTSSSTSTTTTTAQ